MNMKIRLFASMLVLAATPLAAQSPDAPPPLDLKLPAGNQFSDVSDPAADPPGTYYGDVGGEQDNEDHTGVRMSGAFSTTIGYARGYGTGISNSAALNLVKQTEDGKTFGLHLHVTKGDALPYAGRYYRGW
jgi:hypothetical protein